MAILDNPRLDEAIQEFYILKGKVSAGSGITPVRGPDEIKEGVTLFLPHRPLKNIFDVVEVRGVKPKGLFNLRAHVFKGNYSTGTYDTAQGVATAYEAIISPTEGMPFFDIPYSLIAEGKVYRIIL